MKLFKKNPPVVPSKIERRAEVMTTRDLLAWANTSLYDAGRALSAYENHGADPEALEEAEQSAEVFHILLRQLRSRLPQGH